MNPAAAPAADLFAWRTLREAEAACRDAAALRADAAHKYQFSPHGTRQSRLKALQEASNAALAAELELRKARQAAGVSQ